MPTTELSPLANHLWQSTLCALVAWMLALLLRKNRAAVRYGIWLAASIKFLVPFSLLVSAGSHVRLPLVPPQSRRSNARLDCRIRRAGPRRGPYRIPGPGFFSLSGWPVLQRWFGPGAGGGAASVPFNERQRRGRSTSPSRSCSLPVVWSPASSAFGSPFYYCPRELTNT